MSKLSFWKASGDRTGLSYLPIKTSMRHLNIWEQKHDLCFLICLHLNLKGRDAYSRESHREQKVSFSSQEEVEPREILYRVDEEGWKGN